ncbi:MAG: GNAT family N-acetyltransferase, partial [Miltoncostaeaceae bacterium]
RIDLDFNWYRLALADPERPRRPLPDGLSLRRASAEDLALLEQLPDDAAITTFTPGLAADRRGAGHELWLVTDGQRVAFACWIFRGTAEVAGAPGGGAPMPPGTVMLEDSITSPDFRGRGVAPAAWAAIADALAAEGPARMYTTVENVNIPSCTAVEKAGFRTVATMTVAGRPPRRLAFRVHMQDGHDGGDGWLGALANG